MPAFPRPVRRLLALALLAALMACRAPTSPGATDAPPDGGGRSESESPPTDAGSAPPDAGPQPPDGGAPSEEPPLDAGSTPTDGGTPPGDAGSPQPHGHMLPSPPMKAVWVTARPSVAVGRDGTPFLAGSGVFGRTGEEFRVSRWDGTQWLSLGNPVRVDGMGLSSSAPALALDSRERPVIAWRDGSGAELQLRVARFDGTRWDALEGELNALNVQGLRTDASEPALAIDASDRPLVAWSEADARGMKVFARSWSNEAWQPLGDDVLASPSSPREAAPSLALDEHGTPHVAWRQGSGQVDTLRWDGHAWRRLGDTLKSEGPPALTLWRGQPVVALRVTGKGGRKHLEVRHWSAGAWSLLGGALEADGASPSLAVDGPGRLVVAFLHGEAIHVRRWNGGSWEDLSGPLAPRDPSTSRYWNPVVAAGADGTVAVVWAHDRPEHTGFEVWRWRP